ncbi:MAG: type II toxin-antitoxin system RelE/ParE family toxin [Pseudonocardia sp.]
MLHCFHKRTQKTARADLDLALKRYKQVVSEVQDSLIPTGPSN